MAVQVSYPGVYIQEVPSGSRTITGVATAIAAFVGMCKRGPVDTPTTVLGFTDYDRTFGSDTSQGEMTDQVRQFFLNGGQRAVITRIADGALSASVVLENGDASASLTLTSVSAGSDENLLRASVDYNTPSPERTFNLTVFREEFDASGNASQGATETFGNVSMDPSSSRYVVSVIEDNSLLVRGTVSLGTPAGGISYSGAVGANVVTLVNNAIDATGPGGTGGTSGAFVVRIGNQTRTVTLGPIAAVADVAAAINAQFPATVTVGSTAQAVAGGNSSLRIEVTSGTEDIVLSNAVGASASIDIARALGLGVENGGIEVGAYAGQRPLPTGLVSNVGGAGLADLVDFAALTRDSFVADVVLSGAVPVTMPAPDLQNALGGAGTELMLVTPTSTAPSLANLRANLLTIASEFNGAALGNWRAEVHGHRLALIPLFGSAASGPGHSFGAPLNVMFSSLATAIGSAFAGGEDGDVPTPTQYTAAYTIIDSEVDIFNLLILPRSAGDPVDTDRTPLWGPASSFCRDRRAFLIMDTEPDVNSVTEAGEAVVALRAGIVKDHSALYWPKVRVNPDGSPRFIDPSGSLAGVMARIDVSRGVFKAPAGLEADIRGALAVEVSLSNPENGLLNPQALNVVRAFPSGVVSWGARTMDGFDNSGNDDYKYIPVRRLTLFIEESLRRGLQFAVFEPNGEALWTVLRATVGAFMANLFRQGAFAGASQREAFFVKVDEETTTQNDINLGIVNVVVGFAPLKPAEFVVVTIKQQAGQVQV